MCAQKTQDQGIIELLQTDYLPILIELRKSVIAHTLTGKYRTGRGEESAGDGIVL